PLRHLLLGAGREPARHVARCEARAVHQAHPQRAARRARGRGRLTRLEHQRLELTRVTLHVVTAGRGAPLLLLHGRPETWHEWRKVIALLTDHYRVVAPDLPGLGESSPPQSYDKKSIGADLREMCEQLQLEPFHLVGHDWGGPCAFALACAAPRAVRTLTILDVTIPGIGPDISQGGRRW